MTELVYANSEHNSIIDAYTKACKQFIQDVSSETRYKNYLDVIEVIYEYHNNYGSGVKENNFYDWLMIIPINLSVATNGFFAAIETKKNAAVVRAYKVILQEMVGEVVKKIGKIEPQYE